MVQMILIWFFQEELNSKFRKIIRVEERKKFDTNFRIGLAREGKIILLFLGQRERMGVIMG